MVRLPRASSFFCMTLSTVNHRASSGGKSSQSVYCAVEASPRTRSTSFAFSARRPMIEPMDGLTADCGTKTLFFIVDCHEDTK